ncbi:MAG TPA: DMT family transporter [Methylomirabilota bacterium]|nr:DMT family transporter [Methylomirabilota bacterium]
MRSATLLLVTANLVYATSYVAMRLALDDVPPALLALIRVVVGAALLVPIVRLLEPGAPTPSGADARRIAWMGVIGFAGAFAFSNWGVARSTATNAALLIIVEPLSILALSPIVLGERLRAREAAGGVLALLGAVVVVLNGVPGVTLTLAPHWRGDLLLVVAGIAYGAYTLLGRPVLARHSAMVVTAHSIVWGAAVMFPLAALEWLQGARPVLSARGVGWALYLAVVITAFGYLSWNWMLARVPAPQVAIFVTVQPVGGALLGVLLLHEPLTAFTVAGAALIVGGLWLTVGGRR